MKRKDKVLEQASAVITDTLAALKEVPRKGPGRPRKPPEPEPVVWDVPKDSPIEFFDAGLSYELTGYRPITGKKGRDFKPEWFTEARDTYLATGHYTTALFGSKAYRDFWHREYRRCRKGMRSNGYRITGEHYFFLNYYQLPLVEGNSRAGSGRHQGFPLFMVSQYQFFHYLDMARRLHMHCILMKARGIGFSEINASIVLNQYITVRDSISLVTCYDRGKLDKTLSKIWNDLRFLDTHTDNGMRILRQLSDTALKKQAGYYVNRDGNKTPAGWLSVIEGIVADDPQKVRGDRVDYLVMDECFAADTPVLMADYTVRPIQDIKAGDMVLGVDGTPQEVVRTCTGYDRLYRVHSRLGTDYVVNSRHQIYAEIRTGMPEWKGSFRTLMTPQDYERFGKYLKRAVYGLFCPGITGLDDKCAINPYYLGLWLGDGTSGSPDRITVNVRKNPEIRDFLLGFYRSFPSGTLIIRQHELCSDCFCFIWTGSSPFRALFKKYSLHACRHIPLEVFRSSMEYRLQVLAGIIDSGGSLSGCVYEIAMCGKKLAGQTAMLARSCGFTVPKTGHRIIIRGNIARIPVRTGYRRPHMSRTMEDSHISGIRISEAGMGRYYGITLASYGRDTDNLFMLSDFTIVHNCGSWPSLLKAFVQFQALVNVQGVSFGTIVGGGTGGDTGTALEGLRTIYYNPRTYGVLPYRHRMTADGTAIESGYFIPAFTQSMLPGMTDERGWCDPDRCREYLQKQRDQYLAVPQSLIHHCAEYCWTAEEAFALEGDNKFNKILLSEQMAQVRLHRTGPRPVAGYLDYIYKNGIHKPENISGYRWTPVSDGKTLILEHPVWTDLYKQDMARKKREAERKGQPFEAPPAYQEMRDLYVAGVDGIDIGGNQTSGSTRDPSEFCLIVFKRQFGTGEPLIACMYKDRPAEVRTAYKQAMAIIRYYNCKVNVEATRVGFLNWARYSNQLKWFMKRPAATLQNVKNGNTNSYGTPATSAIIEMQTELIAGYIEDWCHTIWYEEILDQMIRYSDANKTKFDIIAALGMALLADQELTGRAPLIVERTEDTFVDFGYYTDEYGYRQYGIIPRRQAREDIKYGGGQTYDPYRIETSDPRFNT